MFAMISALNAIICNISNLKLTLKHLERIIINSNNYFFAKNLKTILLSMKRGENEERKKNKESECFSPIQLGYKIKFNLIITST
jgi:hypothetical protein